MAGLVRAALIRDLGASKVCRTKVAPEQNYEEAKQGGTYETPPVFVSMAGTRKHNQENRCGSPWPSPCQSQRCPGPQLPGTPGCGTPRCTAQALCSTFTENIDIVVFCFEWTEVTFQIIKMF